MDRRLKEILDEFLPYTDDEYPDPDLWKAKTELRNKLADAIIAYKNHKPVELPPIEVDIKEIMKKFNDIGN